MSGARVPSLIAAVAGLGVWAVLLLIAPAAAVQGWHVAMVACALPILGAVGWSLIHRLTGGAWGAAFAPVLGPLARAAPLLLVGFIPVLLSLGWIFPWARGIGGAADVRAGYLNPPFFIGRTLVILAAFAAAGWWMDDLTARRTPVLAGIALAAFGLAVSVLGLDWVLSLQPGWTSSAAGMVFALEALAAALGLVAVLAPPSTPQGGADLSGLLFAMLLGSAYLGYMSYLVVWYGDRPSLDSWYLVRRAEPWAWAPGAAFAIGGLLPTGALILRDRIGRTLSRRIAGAASLIGLLIYLGWQTAPAFGVACLPGAVAALVGQAGCIALATAIIRACKPAPSMAGDVHAGA